MIDLLSLLQQLKTYALDNFVNFFTSSHSKFYFVYVMIFIFGAMLIGALRLNRAKKKISIKGILSYCFPPSIYRTKSSNLDFKILFINMLLIMPIVALLLPVAGLEDDGIPKGIVQNVRLFLQEYFGRPKFNISQSWTIDLAFSFGLFVSADFAFFFAHYLQHKVPFFRALHKLHHTAQVLQPITAYRSHPLSILFQKGMIVFLVSTYIALFRYFVPFKPGVVTIMGVSFMMFFYNIFVLFRHSHVWISFGPLNSIFVSPAMHQLHHSQDPKHVDKNIGLFLSIWDRLFGTLYLPKKEEAFICGLPNHSQEQMLKLQTLKESYGYPVLYTLSKIQNYGARLRNILKNDSNPQRKLYPAAFALAMLGFGYSSGSFDADPFSEFRKVPVPKRVQNNLGFQLKEKASSVGLNHISLMLIPHPDRAHISHFSSVYGGIAVGDVNNDGYVDLYFTRPNQNDGDLLYINNGGQSFTEATQQWGLSEGPLSSTMAAFFDFNKDGYIDLYVAGIGCHKLYINDKGRRFIDASEATGVDKICHWTTSLAVIDYNKDGFSDIYLGNYHPAPGIQDPREYRWVSDRTRANRGGGANIMLKNYSGQLFQNVTDELGVGDTGYTFAIGVGDFNGDSLPDLMVANDFGFSQIYINLQGTKFSNETKSRIGKMKGTASMSASVADINNDGRPDVYMANISDPGVRIGRNVLLLSDREKMREGSVTQQIDRCGFGWGTQFFDANNDGRLDLVAVTGYWNSGPKNYWYKFITAASLPPFLRQNPLVHPTTEGTQLAGQQPSCMFFNHRGKFYDVSEHVGLSDVGQGRGVALLDYNNDGRTDLIVTRDGESPLLYENQPRQSQNNWIGLVLKGSMSPQDGLGAKVEVFRQNGTPYSREAYFTNGYASQSDPRIILGLEKNPAVEIRVYWPSGKISHIKNPNSNQWTIVKESEAQ